MSEQYYCSICANQFPKPGAEYLGSTQTSCKGCLLAFEKAEELLRPVVADGVTKSTHNIREMPTRIAATLINLNRPLEALNFCLSSLDATSKACPAHTAYDRRAALNDLTRYSESDIDPNLPPLIQFAPRPSSYLLFTLTLAAFKVYGACPFTATCLHRAHHSNPSLFDMLADDNPMNMGHGPDGGMMYYPIKSLWEAPGIRAWLNASRGEMEKKFCDALTCDKVEKVVGEWKLCGGCRKRSYCSVACQKQDWRVDGHKKVCQEEKALHDLLGGLSAVWGSRGSG